MNRKVESPCPELTAAGIDINAAALANGAGQPVGGQNVLKAARCDLVTGLAVIADRRVKRDEVDMSV